MKHIHSSLIEPKSKAATPAKQIGNEAKTRNNNKNFQSSPLILHWFDIWCSFRMLELNVFKRKKCTPLNEIAHCVASSVFFYTFMKKGVKTRASTLLHNDFVYSFFPFVLCIYASVCLCVCELSRCNRCCFLPILSIISIHVHFSFGIEGERERECVRVV